MPTESGSDAAFATSSTATWRASPASTSPTARAWSCTRRRSTWACASGDVRGHAAGVPPGSWPRIWRAPRRERAGDPHTAAPALAPVRRPQKPGSVVVGTRDVGQWQVTTRPVACRWRCRCATPAATCCAPPRGRAGRPTRTDVSFYAFGRGRASWKSEATHRSARRVDWKPGESARVLIQSPWDRATALLTTEREGVRSHRQFAITSTQDAFDADHRSRLPNVYVSVMLIKGRTATDITPPVRITARPRSASATRRSSSTIRRNGCKWSGLGSQGVRPKQPATVSVAVTDSATPGAERSDAVGGGLRPAFADRLFDA